LTGRALYLGFTKPYDVNPLGLYVDADEPEEIENVSEPIELEFEVLAQGGRWRKVAAEDLTRGFQRRGLVKLFIDAEPQRRRLFGRELFWLRIHPKKNGEVWRPLLKTIQVNAAEAEQARSIKQEILGASNGEPHQRFFLSKTPVIANSLELRVREALSEEERLELERTNKVSIAARPSESDNAETPVVATYPDIDGEWVLWRQVDSFVGLDGEARVYQLDPASGEVRFGNDKQGKIPPAGRDAVRAVQYQNGGGEAGNVDAFTLENLKSSIESLDSVTNPVAAAGGVDAPDVDRQIATAPDRLRHRQQALTPIDIEGLAVSFSSEIVRARCIPPHEPGQPIQVFIARRTGERCPKASRVEREALARYLLEQGWGALNDQDIRVDNPHYVSVSVMAEVIAESSETAAMVEKEANERLLQFLHPIAGGPQGAGWPFGRGIWKSDLFRILAGIPGLDRVKDIQLVPEGLEILPPSALICAEEEAVKLNVTIANRVN
jgi:predicted phage baseplate assembly protein